MRTGDTRTLGKLMGEAQEIFDSKVAPACPGELMAPVLHGNAGACIQTMMYHRA